MTNEQLQSWVEQLSMRHFGVPFRHRASFNGRLRSTGGRYLLKSHNIEISLRQFEAFGTEEIEKIIKHELCHYHLHLAGRGYRHRDADFKALLQTVGGSRYCQSLPDAEKRIQPYRYRLICTNCRAVYMRKRKVNLRKYACGKCRGRLQSFQLDLNCKS